MALAHDESRAKRKIISDDSGLRGSVVHNPFQTKSAPSIVARVDACVGTTGGTSPAGGRFDALDPRRRR